jgi:hypothetical protein
MRRHRFDPSGVIAGLFFLVLAGVHFSNAYGGVRISVFWAIPAVLIGLGVIGVLRIVFRGRRRLPWV